MFAYGFRALALAASVLLAGCLGPDTPEEQLKSIEEYQAKNLPVTDAKKAELANHLAKGHEALTAGNKEQAMAAFGEAIAILKFAEDAAIYNKAD